MTIRPNTPLRERLAQHAIVVALAMFAVAAPAQAPSAASAPPPAAKSAAAPQPAFATPEAGFEAIVAALRAADAKQLARLLGPGHKRIVDSGDNAADREAWARFVKDYDAKHTIRLEGDDAAYLAIGPDDWPMPIPLVKRADGWSFDAVAGEDEILSRRIGRNELDAIQVCLAFVDMQREYAEADRNGDGLLEYATRLVSSPGKRDGLYWPTKAGEPESPAGPRFAAADPSAKGRVAGAPYHGYYYRLLTAQGPHAPGGARSYLANGKLIGGVALVAYPATYLNSGIKTFMCNLEGVVYEKDLGPGGAGKVAKMKAFDPDPSWTPSK